MTSALTVALILVVWAAVGVVVELRVINRLAREEVQAATAAPAGMAAAPALRGLPTQSELEACTAMILEVGMMLMECTECGEQLSKDAEATGRASSQREIVTQYELSCPHCGAHETMQLPPGDALAIAVLERFNFLEMTQSMADLAGADSMTMTLEERSDLDYLDELDSESGDGFEPA